VIHSICLFWFNQAFSYLRYEIKELDTKIDAKIDKIDTKIGKLGSDILATLDGMHNARYVAAQVAHAVAVHQQPIPTTELYKLEDDLSKKYASESQQRRADEKVPTSSPADGSSVSGHSPT
jgi:hypothetical protein